MHVVSEPVRLLIWDLDETFWKGTLTEGGIEYSQRNHEIVETLASRGIMSSICSKNSLESVKAVLEREGIWDKFVFPSVDWSSKGGRIAKIIEAVQLRPQTVMFIDDNPNVLAEVRDVVPGIQTASHIFIDEILDSPLFKGKDDATLSRLKQYKLLEQKQSEQAAAAGGNEEFLRACNIRVEIEHDVERHLDRAIELINRTNQLNFTKARLPEDQAEARKLLTDLLRRYDINAGLVKVTDKYGDYGFCGFYAVHGELSNLRRLVHFCFSCRTLGMGVEQFVYQFLGKPELMVVGDVIGELDGMNVDWIEIGSFGEHEKASANLPFDELTVIGGCEALAISNPAALDFPNIRVRTNSVTNSIVARFDSSATLAAAVCGRSPENAMLARLVGFAANDLDGSIFQTAANKPAVLCALGSGDCYLSFYRHKFDPSLLLPLVIANYPHLAWATPKDLLESFMNSDKDESNIWAMLAATADIKTNWDFISQGLSDDLVADNLRAAFTGLRGRACVLILPSRLKNDGGQFRPRTDVEHYVALVETIASTFPDVHLIHTDRYIDQPEDINAYPDHFSRRVYFRLYEAAIDVLLRLAPGGKNTLNSSQ